MATALVLVALGVPASMLYEGPGGAPNRNTDYRKHGGWDAMGISKSIDGNIKYVKDGTDHDPDSYNGYENSINASEDAVAPLVAGVTNLSTAVKQLDANVTGIRNTTTTMQEDLGGMLEISQSSADTMGQLQIDIGALAQTMATMYGATDTLATAMGELEAGATGIAQNGTGPALEATTELNDILPERVPAPQTSTMPPPGGQG